jgi:hypothetical protein
MEMNESIFCQSLTRFIKVTIRVKQEWKQRQNKRQITSAPKPHSPAHPTINHRTCVWLVVVVVENSTGGTTKQLVKLVLGPTARSVGNKNYGLRYSGAIPRKKHLTSAFASGAKLYSNTLERVSDERPRYRRIATVPNSAGTSAKPKTRPHYGTVAVQSEETIVAK